MKKMVDSRYKGIGFIYVIPDIGNYDYYEKMQNLVKKYNLEDNFHFHTNPVAYPAVINMCDLFIRPTNTDGYAISIAEAIYFKVPAVASNVVQRPEGTILFKSRDVNDFTVKVKDVLSNYEFHKNRIKNIELGNNVEELLEMYHKLAEK